MNNSQYLLESSYAESQNDMCQLDVVHSHVLHGDESRTKIWIFCVEVEVVRALHTRPATMHVDS